MIGFVYLMALEVATGHGMFGILANKSVKTDFNF
jgi:hypothetical protein